MSTYHFVGVDIAKDEFVASQMVKNKSKQRSFDNSLSGFKAFLGWIQKTAEQPWACMEATGHYGEALAEFLHQKNMHVSVVNPMQIKTFARMMLKRNKNDFIDAQTIREYAEKMKPRFFQPRPPKQKEIRELIQLLDTLKEQSAQLKNKAHAAQHPVAKKEIRMAINAVENRVTRLTQKIKEAASEEPDFKRCVALLLSVKGIGELSAYRLLALLPDIRLFQSPKQLAAFAGVSPQQRESGAWKGKTTLSKCGNASLRKALYMPALSAKRYNITLQPWVNGLQKRGLTPKAIVGAVMRKLIHIIFGILKNNQPFNHELCLNQQKG